MHILQIKGRCFDVVSPIGLRHAEGIEIFQPIVVSILILVVSWKVTNAKFLWLQSLRFAQGQAFGCCCRSYAIIIPLPHCHEHIVFSASKRQNACLKIFDIVDMFSDNVDSSWCPDYGYRPVIINFLKFRCQFQISIYLIPHKFWCIAINFFNGFNCAICCNFL